MYNARQFNNEKNPMKKYLAITSKGLENLLADELIALGVTDPKVVHAGVKFEAPIEVFRLARPNILH